MKKYKIIENDNQIINGVIVVEFKNNNVTIDFEH